MNKVMYIKPTCQTFEEWLFNFLPNQNQIQINIKSLTIENNKHNSYPGDTNHEARKHNDYRIRVIKDNMGTRV